MSGATAQLGQARYIREAAIEASGHQRLGLALAAQRSRWFIGIALFLPSPR
jgi:hypothetical protein